MFDNPSQPLPEIGLLIATLERAVLDYHGNVSAHRSEAEDWIFTDAEDEKAYSFGWVCRNLGVDAAAFRARLGHKDLKQKLDTAHRWLRTRVQRRVRKH